MEEKFNPDKIVYDLNYQKMHRNEYNRKAIKYMQDKMTKLINERRSQKSPMAKALIDVQIDYLKKQFRLTRPAEKTAKRPVIPLAKQPTQKPNIALPPFPARPQKTMKIHHPPFEGEELRWEGPRKIHHPPFEGEGLRHGIPEKKPTNYIFVVKETSYDAHIFEQPLSTLKDTYYKNIINYTSFENAMKNVPNLQTVKVYVVGIKGNGVKAVEYYLNLLKTEFESNFKTRIITFGCPKPDLIPNQSVTHVYNSDDKVLDSAKLRLTRALSSMTRQPKKYIKILKVDNNKKETYNEFTLSSLMYLYMTSLIQTGRSPV